MLKKIFLAMIAILFIFVGSCSILMGYFIFNPRSIETGLDWISDQAFKTQPFSEKQEFFLQGITDISVESTQVPLLLKIYNGSTLFIEVSGQVQGDVKTLLSQRAEGSSLRIQLVNPDAFSSFHLQINGQNVHSNDQSEIKATAYLPKSYLHKITLSTTQAPIGAHLPLDYYAQLNLRSESGKIENNWKPQVPAGSKELKIGEIEIQTESGHIQVENIPL